MCIRDRRDLARALFGARRLHVMFLPPEDPSLETLRAAARGRAIVRTLERSPYVAIEGDWESYERGLDQHLVKELRRRRRRLDEQGVVEVEVRDGTHDLEALLDEGFRVEAAGWKGEQKTAIASEPATRRFYTEVARWGVERGELRLVFLRVDGRAIAFNYAWEAQGVHYLLKTGLDPEYARYAPGKLIVEAMIKRAHDHGFTMYDFLGDTMPWKLEWTDRVRELKLLQAFAPTAAGLADWAAWSFGRPLAKRALALARR